jgi:hypothetical protein
MALNRLQKALINSHIGPRTSGLKCQNIFFKREHIIFLTLLIEIFYSKKNSVSQVYTYLPKNKKKKLKDAIIVDA